MSDSPTQAPLPAFDPLWNYGDPAGTEAKFRALLPAAQASENHAYTLELKTQIARTLGLQRKFHQAHALLDEVERASQSKTVPDVVRVRTLLERGRAFNSNGEKGKARPLFLEAWQLAQNAKEDGYAVDAAHMMGIIEPTKEAIVWNEKAMGYAEASSDPRAKKWLGSLYNNMGWTYHDAGNFERALDLFRKGVGFREKQGKEEPLLIARWSVARALRSLKRFDEALVIQEALLDARGNQNPDGYVFEELGWLYTENENMDKAKKYFALAHGHLSKDTWFVNNEAARLEELKRRSE